ncbi:kinesin-like protein subito [Anopheles bellator]|uniref:kinesin-like protein subito n=1 Tax=Anopheles bellator TaxID=139047 RepID=UPI0026482D07|nr:kinesin-like protein subito [Anopheles bellator]XP_058067112.1 kinesin-like protein subito [Anopheles bellator]
MHKAKPSFLEAAESSVDRRKRPRPMKGNSWESLLAERQSRIAIPEEEISPASGVEDELADAEESTELKDEETVKVCLRLRPYIKSNSGRMGLKIKDNMLIARCIGENQSSSEKRFTFSHIYDDHVSQADVYDSSIRPMIRPGLGEPGATILTYGTSASGKTYTLLGNQHQPGVVPRCIEQIYAELKDSISTEPTLKMDGMKPCLLSDELVIEEMRKLTAVKDQLQSEDGDQQISDIIQSQQQFEPLQLGDRRVFIWISFVEIYNENVYDLLNLDLVNSKRKPLKVLANEGNAYIKGLTTLYAGTKEGAYNLLEFGLQSATYGSTDINRNSSRSHSIFTITVITHSVATQRIAQSVYKFCDLAGSERLKKTGNMGDRLKEAQKINNSLLVLGRCLETVHKNQKSRKVHDLVPVRDSKLTMIVQSALLGKEPMTMIVNVYPTDEFYDENINVLNFSSIAKQIVIRKEQKMLSKAPESTRYSFFLAQAVSSPSCKIDLSNLLRENERLKLEVQQLREQVQQKSAEHASFQKQLAMQEFLLRNELTDNFQLHFTQMEESYQKRVESAKELAILPYKHKLTVLEKKLQSREQIILDMEEDQEEYENKLKVYEEEVNRYRLQQKGVRRLSL